MKQTVAEALLFRSVYKQRVTGCHREFGVIMQWAAAAARRPEHQPLEEWTLSSHCVADSTEGCGGV